MNKKASYMHQQIYLLHRNGQISLKIHIGIVAQKPKLRTKNKQQAITIY